MRNLGLNFRAWKDFINTSKFQAPQPNQWFPRVQANLIYFSGNYAILCGLIFLYGILHTPLIIIPIGFALVAWSYLFMIRQTSLRIGGTEISTAQKYAAIVGLSLFLLFYTSGLTIFWVMGISATLVMLHASFRLPASGMTRNFLDEQQPTDSSPISITVIGNDEAGAEMPHREHYFAPALRVKYDLNRGDGVENDG